MVDTVRRLAQARDLDSVMAVVRVAARELTGADGATFVLRDGDKCFYADEYAIAPLWKGQRFPMSACISGWAMIHKETAVIEDIFADPRIPVEAYRPTFVKSLVMTPIRANDPVGAIGNYWAKKRRPREEEVRVLQALADTTAVAMENVRIYADLNQRIRDMTALTQAAPLPIITLDPLGRVTSQNPAATQLFGDQAASVPGLEYLGVSTESVDQFSIFLNTLSIGGQPDSLSVTGKRHDGTTADLRVVGGSVANEDGSLRSLVLIIEDESQRVLLEQQFLQAQKMEAVGHLAGGVAHDFNNLLTVILGYGGFLQRALPESNPLRRHVDQVNTAAQRASALTRQLLAFSRKQVLKPEVIDINGVVQGLEPMLHRLIGENIRIDVKCAADLGKVKFDPGQIEQVLMNLVVNARDAMPDGGTISIETANVELDAGYVKTHAEAQIGPHVALYVSDSGTGMDRATMEKIFEPFFTTKGVGKGTGLGLSTVFGIVKQSGGNIWVYSELGRGTTFKVYIPRVDAKAVTATAKSDGAAAVGGDEVILLVEDEDQVRDFLREVLTEAGYTVLCAGHADEAEKIFDEQGDSIQLLLTDVVLPGRSGKRLADGLIARRPELKILFMSGYTDDVVITSGELAPGEAFMEKPVNAQHLLKKLREILSLTP
ncbi:MAG: hypothetical protein A2516_07200 [Alphaproteobacteria bacterium RIFOXYD12_FULL_60_8]|nr:MAG: hypothetical protein A2516_07200 [Alphaproteobacteria bacterium RIFOXYD12_FULL_60_8]